MKELILLAAFGTSEPQALIAYEKIEKEVKAAFPQAEIRYVYTSSMIRKKLAKQGKIILSPEEGLEKGHKDGFKKVTLQTLHVIPGIEYEDLLKETASYRKLYESFYVGTPLIGSYEDATRVAEILLKLYGKREQDEAMILMGHGTTHVNTLFYVALNSMLQNTNPQIFLGTVEGFPNLEETKEKIKKFKKVTLAPFMIVAGDHARNDMGGSEEDSWKSQFEKMGMKATPIYQGLGEFEEIAKIFTDHIKKAQKG